MTPRSIPVGTARVSIINIGDVTLPLAEAMGLSGDSLAAGELRDLAHQRVIPLQSVLIEHEGLTLLVDSGLYDVGPDSEYEIPGYTPPPPQRAQLATLGVQPERVNHVVITHRHWDHCNGLAVHAPAGAKPAFPNAVHHLGAADWATIQSALAKHASPEAQALGVVHRAGLLRPTTGPVDLGYGVSIIPAPGETAGHQLVRLHSAGDTLYVVGDLYHHPAEIAHADWMTRWAEPASTAATRRWFTERAHRENALIIASHVPEIGRLGGPPDSPRWVPELDARTHE